MQGGRKRVRGLRRGIVLTLAGAAGIGLGVAAGLVALLFGISSPPRTPSVGAAALTTHAAASPSNGTARPTASLSATPTAAPAAVGVPSATPVPTPAATYTAVTAPSPAAASAGSATVATPFGGMTLEQEVGQLFILGFDGSDDGNAIAPLITRGHAGNVLVRGGNAHDPLQLRELTDALQARAQAANGVGLLVAVDQEGGAAQPLSPPFWTALPNAVQMAAEGTAQIAAYGRRAGAELLQAGINMDLAPVLDLAGTPPAGVGDRAFSADPATAGGFGLAFAQGLGASGVIAAVAHFPGLGDAAIDPRTGLPVDSRPETDLRADDLPPFASVVRTGTEVVLVGDGVYPAWDAYAPALLSVPVIGGLLRGELGFRGMVMTDDLAAPAIRQRWPPGQAAVQAVQAGADLLLISGPPADQAAAIDAVIAAVRDGRIPRAQIDAAAARVLALKLRHGLAGPR